MGDNLHGNDAGYAALAQSIDLTLFDRPSAKTSPNTPPPTTRTGGKRMKAAKWTVTAVICASVALGLYTNAAATAATIGAVLVLGLLYVYFIYFGRPSHVASLNEVADTKWHTVDLGRTTVSADGSAYRMFVRRGTSSNLVIHFYGGGACWDGETAARPITLLGVVRGYTRELQMFYFNSLTRLFPAVLAGMADRRDTTNAFRDWNFVFVPYSTGDLHVGDTSNTYSHNGKTITVHHNGRNNATAVLDWVYANFPEADKVLVSGESAGAWASAFYAPQIADHYTDSKLYCLSDGVGVVTERWRDIVDTIWKADSAKKPWASTSAPTSTRTRSFTAPTRPRAISSTCTPTRSTTTPSPASAPH
ncbi:pectin acetylesterase-family hydrolase [Nonomuraea salmonea]|uniref:pectin acetylesterase-family hydrolase n=1 Tax=Nonomuraea salmonea TaxID=46181 RepID=UPI0031EA358F